MSAYIVDSETINNIVGLLAHHHDQRHIWVIYPLRNIGYDLSKPGHLKRLAEEMFTLNCQSVDERYEEGAADEMGGDSFPYEESKGMPPTMIQQVKSLSCYLYQSCESECDKTALYQALNKIKGILACHIVSELPAYDKAKWE